MMALHWLEAGYALVTVLCAGAAIATARGSARGLDRLGLILWLLTGALVLGLGLNKHLYLQKQFNIEARQIAKAEGWYRSYRRPVQMVASGLTILGGVALWVLYRRRRRRDLPRYSMAVGGAIYLVCFALVRLYSLHQVDSTVRWAFKGVTVDVALEAVGLVCIAVSAFDAIFRARRPVADTDPDRIVQSASSRVDPEP